MLTQSELKALLDYNPDTGIFTWLVRPNNFVKIGQVAGALNGRGYLTIRVNYVHYPAHRLAFLWMIGTWPKNETDHINGVRTDNRWTNLRDVTKSENIQNLGGPRADNASGFIGVHFAKDRGAWRAGIRVNGKHHNLGYFNTPEAAHAAYLKAKHELHPTHQRLRHHPSPHEAE